VSKLLKNMTSKYRLFKRKSSSMWH